jgi:hypothetical protein
VCTKRVKPAREISACTKGVKTPGSHAIGDELARLEIMTLVKECKKCPVKMMDTRTSAFKDVLGSVVRLLLGEIFSESMGQMTADSIGCTPEMFEAGIQVKMKRDQLVGSNAAHSASKGQNNKNARPNVQDFLRSVFSVMCPRARGWQSKAVLTSFVCTWFFSILQGGSHCSCVDNWKISVAGSDARKKKNKKKTNGSEQEDQEEAPEEEEGTEVPAGEAEVPDGADPSALAALQKLPNSWPPAVGGVRYVKDFSGKRLEYYLQRCLTIIRNGGFHLMAHAREEIKEKNLRGSGEKRESMLTEQVFKYVSDNLFQERTGNPASTCEVGCDYENFYTQEKNASDVEEMFGDPESSNFTWITVNPHKCAEGFGFTVANILHHLEKQKRSDDDIKMLSTILKRVWKFVVRSDSGLCPSKKQSAQGTERHIHSR